MISCERAQSLFGPAWDDELSVAEREILEQHFIACETCRRDYDEYARTLEIVQGLPRPQVSGDFATRVLAEARRREAEGAGRIGFLPRLLGRPAAVAIAAALLVAAGVSGALLMRPAFGPAHAPQVAQAPVSAPATARSVGDPDVPVSDGHAAGPLVASATNVPAKTAAPAVKSAPPASAPAVAAVPDSLFDHTADVEFVLDPVKLRRERGRGYTPVPSSVRAEQASITF